jgi:hypothetical protein
MPVLSGKKQNYCIANPWKKLRIPALEKRQLPDDIIHVEICRRVLVLASEVV